MKKKVEHLARILHESLLQQVPRTPRTAKSHRERLQAMLEKYEPTKAGQVDALLKKFEGKEEALIRSLVKKHGPEPGTEGQPPPATGEGTPREEEGGTSGANTPREPSAAGAKTPRTAKSHRERLQAMLEKYEPTKAGQVDALLKKFEGKEEALIRSLVKKHGPEPGTEGQPPPATGEGTPREEEGGTSGANTPREPSAAGAKTPRTAKSHRERLQAMLEKYEPTKAGQVDALLKKFEGKEEALIRSLVKKHGPEPGAEGQAPSGEGTPREEGGGTPKEPLTPRDTPAPTTATAKSHRERLQAMLEKYEPTKAGQVDALLKKFEGKEEALIRSLVKKHGPEPGAEGQPPPATGEGTPREEEGGTSGANTPREPSAAGAKTPRTAKSHRERLQAMLEKYEPTKAGQVDALLKKFEGKEEALIRSLVKKHGPEPGTEGQPPSGEGTPKEPLTPRDTPAPATAASKSHRERLQAMLEKYEPTKAGQVDALLKKFEGKEEALIRSLVKKHGPEPGGSSSAPVADAAKENDVDVDVAEPEAEQDEAANAVAEEPTAPTTIDDKADQEVHENDAEPRATEPQPPASSVAPPSALPESQPPQDVPKRRLKLAECAAGRYVATAMERATRDVICRHYFECWKELSHTKSVSREANDAVAAGDWCPSSDGAGFALLGASPPLVVATVESEMARRRKLPAAQRLHKDVVSALRTLSSGRSLPRGCFIGPKEAVDVIAGEKAAMERCVARIAELEKLLQEANAAGEPLRASLQSVQLKLDAEVKANDALRARQDELTSELATTQALLEVSRNDVAQMKLMVEELKQELANEQRGIPSAIEQALAAKDEHIATLHQRLAATRMSLHKHKRSEQALTEELHVAEEQLQWYRQRTQSSSPMPPNGRNESCLPIGSSRHTTPRLTGQTPRGNATPRNETTGDLEEDADDDDSDDLFASVYRSVIRTSQLASMREAQRLKHGGASTPR